MFHSTVQYTPLSPDDDPSDFDDDDADNWTRYNVNSHRSGHYRTASMVSIAPRQRRRVRERETIITSESWEKEELEIGRRSWKTPDLDVVEDKIEARRLAKESRSTNVSCYGSAPSSSGKSSYIGQSSSINGSIISDAVEEDETNGVMSADDTDSSG